MHRLQPPVSKKIPGDVSPLRMVRQYYKKKLLHTKTLAKCGLKDDNKTLCRLCFDHPMKVSTVKKDIKRNGKKMTLSYEMNIPTGEGVRFSDASETSKVLGKDRIAAKTISNMDTTSCVWKQTY